MKKLMNWKMMLAGAILFGAAEIILCRIEQIDLSGTWAVGGAIFAVFLSFLFERESKEDKMMTALFSALGIICAEMILLDMLYEINPTISIIGFVGGIGLSLVSVEVKRNCGMPFFAFFFLTFLLAGWAFAAFAILSLAFYLICIMFWGWFEGIGR